MGVPQAVIVHRSARRLRVRIFERRGDALYFETLHQKLNGILAPLQLSVNAQTASALITGGAIDIDALAAHARAQRLFQLAVDASSMSIPTMSIAAPLRSANRAVRRWSGGAWDLPGGIFAALVLFGIIELLRGNWKTPPWYTAFWYAFGLYSRALFEAAQHPGDSDTVPPDF